MTILVVASFGRILLTIAFVAVSLLLIGLVLLQKNRGAGLSGAFGGVGGHTAFGTKTGDFLTWVTVSLTALFLLLSIMGNYVFEPAKSGASPPVATAPPGPSSPPPPGAPGPVGPATATPVAPAPAEKTENSSTTIVKPVLIPSDDSTTPTSAPAGK
ncbi:MAG TPA: preprotein translocase subunit SecG [Phycisphaerae bacterium]|nr:preprotein translocase subunit SecG [Phycisphaerae bacterium]